MARRAIRLVVEGLVQGVGYRWWTVREAQALGLEGWVRNRRDGSVEVLAMGATAAIEALAAACAKGPSGAQVQAVRRETAEDDGASGFHERPTL